MLDERMCNRPQAERIPADRAAIERLPVAMAYVPWQHWEELYELTKGYKCGTIFPSLNKPFNEGTFVRGGCKI